MRSNERRSSILRWWIVVAAAVMFLLIAYLALPKLLEIRTDEAVSDVLEIPLSSIGVVEADLADVSPQITAPISTLYAEEGQTVAKGSPIAQLASDDLLAEVSRLEAAVRAASEEVAAREGAASSEAAQLRAAADRAAAAVTAARERLRELEAGARVEDIDTQRAVLAQATARAGQAQKSLARAESLFEAGAISAQELDDAHAANAAASAEVEAQTQQLRGLEAGARLETVRAARAEVSAAEAAHREARSALGLISARSREVDAARARLSEAQAALKAARARLSYSTINSPFNGLVVRKHKQVGETATPLDPIYTVADLERIWVTAEVDEEDVAAVQLGQAVTITLDAYPGKEVKGSVIRVSRIAEPKDVGRVRAKVVRARIALEESDVPLKPGMEVNVNGSVPSSERTILVPNDAVIRLSGVQSVFVIEEGVARSRPVEIGRSNFDHTQIVSGLRAGEMVAVTKLEDLSDGKRVKVVR